MENRYLCKRTAARLVFGQVNPMGRQRKPRERKEPKSELHALFARRVQEELDRRELTATGLQKYGAVQRTLWDVLNAGSDPRLSTIRKTAKALGMNAAADLLREGPDKRVINMSDRRPIPKIMGENSHSKADDRKRRRG